MLKNICRSMLGFSPRTTKFLRAFRDSLDQHSLPKETPWGFTLAGHKAMAEGTFEPQETLLVRKLLEEVDMLVNVGANIGYYCCHALNIGKPVVAIEPNARNVHYLLKNIRNNDWTKKAQVFPCAVGSEVDILEMYGGGTGASLIKGWASIPESYATLVPVSTLDRILGDTLKDKKVLFVVDIEGSELMMLEGATQALNLNPPSIWMIEISATEHQPKSTPFNPNYSKTFEKFFSLGYRAYSGYDLKTEITADRVNQVVRHEACFDTHNFIFRK